MSTKNVTPEIKKTIEIIHAFSIKMFNESNSILRLGKCKCEICKEDDDKKTI